MLASKVSTPPPDLERDVSVPPLKQPANPNPPIYPLSPDGDLYFKSANPIAIDPAVLAGRVDWSFHFRETGQDFKDFDPTQFEELYLIVTYTLE
jgi:hypothetical protein